MEKMELPGKSVETLVGERRRAPRVHLLTRVDLVLAGTGDTFWGSLTNLSWTGAALSLRQPVHANQQLNICFRFRGESGKEVTETLAARVVWRSGDNTGVEFAPPLTTGSPALQQARFLVAHLMMKDA